MPVNLSFRFYRSYVSGHLIRPIGHWLDYAQLFARFLLSVSALRVPYVSPFVRIWPLRGRALIIEALLISYRWQQRHRLSSWTIRTVGHFLHGLKLGSVVTAPVGHPAYYWYHSLMNGNRVVRPWLLTTISSLFCVRCCFLMTTRPNGRKRGFLLCC